MKIPLLPALLFSSQGQAERFIYEGYGLVARKRYRLLVSRYSVQGPEQEQDTFTLHLYHVSYPDHQDGKGWGNPVIAEWPYRTVQKQGKQALLDYLAEFGIATDDETWKPIEPEVSSAEGR